jgi:hypothetical protein
MMSPDDLVNWAFAWLLTGAVLWALMYAGGLIEEAIGNASRPAKVMVAIGAIVGWPIIVVVFIAGIIHGVRRRARP